MGGNMPFATHGGLAVRHTFPLDGEYVFKLLLKRGSGSGPILGIEEDEYQIEVRVDHALITRFAVGGRAKGLNSGTMVAIDEDDLTGQEIHRYRMHADDDLEVRVPHQGGYANRGGDIHGLGTDCGSKRFAGGHRPAPDHRPLQRGGAG